MELEYLSGYLTGLMNMSSSLSTYIGPSYIKVHCYEKNSFKEEFKKNYKLKEEVELIETNQSLETTLLDWFGDDKKMIESITYWFNLTYPGDKKVYYVSDDLKNTLDNKRRDFYCLDDLFIVECKNKEFVFLLGNNE